MAEALAPAAEAPPPTAGRGPYACRLALKLIQESLGPVCQKVVQCFIDHGTQQVGSRSAAHAPLQQGGHCGLAAGRSLQPAWPAGRRFAGSGLFGEARPGPPAITHTSSLCSSMPKQYGDLVRVSGMPPAQLRAGLLVLIQHNYVNVYLK